MTENREKKTVGEHASEWWLLESRAWIQALPLHMRKATIDYVLCGNPIGGFLTALFSDRLVEAFLLADPANSAHMKLWAMFVNAAMPPESWGSPEKVKVWQQGGGLAEKALCYRSPNELC